MKFVPIIALILLFIFSWQYVENKKSACCGSEATAIAGVDVASDQTSKSADSVISTSEAKRTISPLVFQKSAESVVTNNGFNAYRDSIISGLREGQILEITGEYFADEKNNTSFDNLGLARADETKKLFVGKIDDNRIRTNGKLVTRKRENDSFVGATFRNITDNAAVKEIDNKALIFFNFGSNQKINDARIDTYLSDVADRIKKSGERVRLTGHTDSKGSDADNQRLGQKRAEVVKQILVRKGVASNKIVTDSKGESIPLATNNTDEGRQKNRRTELEIIR